MFWVKVEWCGFAYHFRGFVGLGISLRLALRMAEYRPTVDRTVVDVDRLGTGIHQFHLCQPLNAFLLGLCFPATKQQNNHIQCHFGTKSPTSKLKEHTINLASGGALTTITV